MLKRVENVQSYYRRDALGLVSGSYRIGLQIGRKEHVSKHRVDPATFRQMAADSQDTPVLYLTVGDRSYWRYQDRWFSDNEHLTAEQVRALLTTREHRRQATINRAQTTTAMLDTPRPTYRHRIPDDVKMLVWTRDGGACARCGTNAELQYDHIVPIAAGGSNEPANLQILCGPCNRLKGASIV